MKTLVLLIISGAFAMQHVFQQGNVIYPNPSDTFIYCLHTRHHGFVQKLCISNYLGARNITELRANGIELVVSANSPPVERDPYIVYAEYALDDTPDQPVLCTAQKASNRMQFYKNILVHCAAGVSRSATLLVAHMLFSDHTLSLKDALAQVRTVRAVANPNPGFMRQLEFIEKHRSESMCTNDEL